MPDVRSLLSHFDLVLELDLGNAVGQSQGMSHVYNCHSRPVCGCEAFIESLPLELLVVLVRHSSGFIRNVDGAAVRRRTWRTIIVHCPGLPEDQVAWLCADLDPIRAFPLKPGIFMRLEVVLPEKHQQDRT